MNKVFVEVCPACLTTVLLPHLHVTDFRASKESFELYRCQNCGLVITQNHPAEIEITRYYETEDYISHSENGTSVMDRVYYFIRNWMARRKRKLIQRYAKGHSLIDIGAGTGFFIAHMQSHEWDVKGIEPNAQARQVAFQSHRILLSEPAALFETPSQSADVITMWHVLEHVHALDKYLDRIRKILRDNGVLFIALPNYKSLDANFYGPDWGAWDVPRHLWHFSPNSVKVMLARAGFEFVHQYAMPFDAFYVALLSEKYRGGGFVRLIRGMTIGLFSYLRALFNSEKASSVIYIFKKSNSLPQ